MRKLSRLALAALFAGALATPALAEDGVTDYRDRARHPHAR